MEDGGGRVFLDAKDLLPGDVWPKVLAEAQESSAVTVIVVSNNSGTAYYQLEELAAAIAMSREANPGHRVAPVYVEKVDRIPYGLRVVHRLWALDDTGLGQAATQLLRLLTQATNPYKVWSPLIPARSRFFAGRDEILGARDRLRHPTLSVSQPRTARICSH